MSGTDAAEETAKPTYRERREARAERLRGWSDKRAVKADAALTRARAMGDAIPFGQPILIGHHSEGRDRNYRARINSTTARGYEHQDKSESMAAKAANIESALKSSIYSDDANAVPALEARVAQLEAERDAIKAYNASARKGAPDTSHLSTKQKLELEQARRHMPFSMGKTKNQYPDYGLTNLTGNIARNRKRLAQLKAKAGRASDG